MKESNAKMSNQENLMNVVDFQKILFSAPQEIPPTHNKAIFINIDQEFFGKEKTDMLMQDLKYSLNVIFDKYKHWNLKIGVVMDVVVPK